MSDQEYRECCAASRRAALEEVEAICEQERVRLLVGFNAGPPLYKDEESRYAAQLLGRALARIRALSGPAAPPTTLAETGSNLVDAPAPPPSEEEQDESTDPGEPIERPPGVG